MTRWLDPLRHRAYRLRGALRQAASAAHERRHLRAFQAFHAGLADRRNAVYMFFTGNLLHWLSRALSFVPPEVNLVLIGSDLTPAERAWVALTGRPFHCVEARLDDNAVLDFIFQTARHHFAWLHIDCFVLNPSLFGEMMSFAPDVAMNCIWTHPGPVETMHSAFVAINHDVLAAIRRAGVDVSPATYHYAGAATGRTVTRRPLYSRVPTARQVELVGRLLAADESGLPAYPVGGCFEILELYQLVANALGYRLRHLRRLRRDGTVSAEQYSNEIIHVNGVSTYKSYKHAGDGKSYIDNQEYLLLLQADYAILLAMGGDVPRQYLDLRSELAPEIQALGLSDAAVTRNLSGFLLSRGISPESCARILGAAAA
jgi:hypothetical protein